MTDHAKLIAKSREIIADCGSLTGPSVERLCAALEQADLQRRGADEMAAEAAKHWQLALKRAEAAEASLEQASHNWELAETDLKTAEAALHDVVTQYPLVHGEPVPAWIRNASAVLPQGREKRGDGASGAEKASTDDICIREDCWVSRGFYEKHGCSSSDCPFGKQVNRCSVTGNPCGTDTWEVSYQCPCESCQAWVRDQEPAPATEREQSGDAKFCEDFLAALQRKAVAAVSADPLTFVAKMNELVLENAQLKSSALQSSEKLEGYRKALTNHESPQLWRLSWLDSLLSEIDNGTFGRIGEDEDPSATREMIEEVRTMAKDLRAALQRGEG